MKSVKLGHKIEGIGSPVPAQTSKPPKEIHPQVHIEADEEVLKKLKDLPEAGIMRVRYCVVRKSVRNEHEGKKTGSLDIDLMEILGAQAESEDEEDGSTALDKLAKDVYDE
jgi:hypothetical protein